MRKIRYHHTLLASALLVFSASSLAEQLPNCESVVRQGNEQLMHQSSATINDTQGLSSLIRQINQHQELPASYVTTDKAKRFGWSGNTQESIWASNLLLENKSIGGDAYDKSPSNANERWYSADVDSLRGYRSGKHLIYQPANATYYLTTNDGSSFVAIPQCL